MAIHVLPEEVVARIAAGEAVERPASVAKELIENAIDAGASSIHVEVAGGGRQLLRVSDNGAGIPDEEINLAFRRHATSKLRNLEDLEALTTLGFRGEALASIAAVSQATIITRQREGSAGIRLNLDGGALRHQERIGAPAGTVITIENLFFNTPARLKFLKSDTTEKRHIHWVAARYAMAYPGIAFVLKQDGRERFRSSGNGDLADVVSRAMGLKAFKNMVAVDCLEQSRLGRPQMQVAGFTSLPAISRASRDRIIFFVNGRAVQDSTLSRAITQAYDGLLKAGAFPLAVLLISTPADFVDVNVHPTKAEVRFRDSNAIFLAVQRAVREALIESGDKLPAADMWSASGFSERYIDYRPTIPEWRRFEGDDLLDDPAGKYIPELAELPAKPRTLPVLRLVGQVGAAYIVAEAPAGLYLLDQNAAHERLLYEELLEDTKEGGLRRTALDEGQSIALDPPDAALLENNAPLLSKFGFEIEAFGPNTYLIRSLPACIARKTAADLLPPILKQLRQTGADEGALLAALAAAGALRRGQVLAEDEMRALIAKLEYCRDPLASPSGQKIFIHLSSAQLAEEFQRA